MWSTMSSRTASLKKDLVLINVDTVSGAADPFPHSKPLNDTAAWRPQRKFLLVVTAAGETNAGMSPKRLDTNIEIANGCSLQLRS